LLYVLGYYWQLTGIAVAFLLATFINFVFCFLIARSLVGPFFKIFLTNILKPAAFCLLMVFLIYFYKHYIGYEGFLHTAVEIAIGATVYCGLTLMYKLSFAEIKTFRQAF
jgi:lipopolysaccharide exporter